jgi:hypothetical protein
MLMFAPNERHRSTARMPQRVGHEFSEDDLGAVKIGIGRADLAKRLAKCDPSVTGGIEVAGVEMPTSLKRAQNAPARPHVVSKRPFPSCDARSRESHM